MGEENVRELDVRTIDDESIGEIVSALEEVPPDGSLRLIDGFEPVPLYDVLEQRGFEYVTEEDGDAYPITISPVDPTW